MVTGEPPAGGSPVGCDAVGTAVGVTGFGVRVPKMEFSEFCGLRRAPPIARIMKPRPESSKATPTTIPNKASWLAM